MNLLEMIGVKPIFAFWGGIGLLLHFLKTWHAANTRNEAFFKQQTYLFYAINAVTTLAVIGIGGELPPEMYTPSTVSSLLVGLSSSSMLSGFIKVKAPFEMVPEDKAVLNITKNTPKEDTP